MVTKKGAHGISWGYSVDSGRSRRYRHLDGPAAGLKEMFYREEVPAEEVGLKQLSLH